MSLPPFTNCIPLQQLSSEVMPKMCQIVGTFLDGPCGKLDWRNLGSPIGADSGFNRRWHTTKPSRTKRNDKTRLWCRNYTRIKWYWSDWIDISSKYFKLDVSSYHHGHRHSRKERVGNYRNAHRPWVGKSDISAMSNHRTYGVLLLKGPWPVSWRRYEVYTVKTAEPRGDLSSV